MSKVNKIEPSQACVGLAIKSINEMMKRKKIAFADICRAVTQMADERQTQTIIKLYAEGNSIRKIARLVRMDDRRVSAILKAYHPSEKAVCPKAKCVKGVCKKSACKKTLKK